MICLFCSGGLIWQNDFTCEDVYFCTCESGIISFWDCPDCDARYQITLHCEGD
jgi:hypothetical protein